MPNLVFFIFQATLARQLTDQGFQMFNKPLKVA
jgi:hypothetical protein